MSSNAADPQPLNIVVIGASGDLALGKIIPALFALYSQGLIPGPFRIFGFARTPMTDEEFRRRAGERLLCRYVPGHSCEEYSRQFLARCFYHAGQYDAADSFLDLYQRMHRCAEERGANHLFYLAVPPGVFLRVAQALGDSGLACAESAQGWTRVVIEKPFGRDRGSSDQLVAGMQRVFAERQIYRIDHYLGKELVQDLMVLRFANLVFEPLWNARFIASVHVAWSEDIGVEARGGYFEDYGIIRDVMQNHLLQILALVAMERPAAWSAHAIRNAKVNLLRRVAALGPDDLLLGQYRGITRGAITVPSYRQAPQVHPDSLTATYAAARLRIDNRRWRGVPFLLSAGKALRERRSEIRIRFRDARGSIFGQDGIGLPANELVIRIQPDEAIELRIMNKVPGLSMKIESTNLNLRYAAAYHGGPIPDAYERLLLDVLHGDRSLFIRADELAAAWDIFTPALRAVEADGREPLPYDFGSAGPDAAEAWFHEWCRCRS